MPTMPFSSLSSLHKMRMEMKNELFSHHSKLSLLFPPHTLLHLQLPLGPSDLVFRLVLSRWQLASLSVIREQVYYYWSISLLFFVALQEKLIGERLMCPPPPDLILCWALEQYNSNCGFVSVRDWGRDHLKWYLWIYVQRRVHSNIPNLHYFLFNIIIIIIFIFILFVFIQWIGGESFFFFH